MLPNLSTYQYNENCINSNFLNIIRLVLIQIIKMDTRDVIGATQKTDVNRKLTFLFKMLIKKEKKEELVTSP